MGTTAGANDRNNELWGTGLGDEFLSQREQLMKGPLGETACVPGLETRCHPGRLEPVRGEEKEDRARACIPSLPGHGSSILFLAQGRSL